MLLPVLPVQFCLKISMKIAYLIGITKYQSWRGPPVQVPLFTNEKTEAHREGNDLTVVIQ